MKIEWTLQRIRSSSRPEMSQNSAKKHISIFQTGSAQYDGLRTPLPKKYVSQFQWEYLESGTERN